MEDRGKDKEDRENKEDLEPRVEDLEDKVNGVDSKQLREEINRVDDKIDRVVSNLESEEGTSIRGIRRLSEDLLGKRNEKYGGLIGSIFKEIEQFKRIIAGIAIAVAIIGFIFMVYEFLLKVSSK